MKKITKGYAGCDLLPFAFLEIADEISTDM
jgi:hypothetical protein